MIAVDSLRMDFNVILPFCVPGFPNVFFDYNLRLEGWMVKRLRAIDQIFPIGKINFRTNYYICIFQL